MKRFLALLSAIILMLVCLVGCSNKLDSDNYYPEYGSSDNSDVGIEMGGNGQLIIDGISPGTPSIGVGSNSGNSSNSNNSSNMGKNELPSVNEQVQYPTKVIKNFVLQAETKKFDEALSELQRLLGIFNGYIENSSIVGNTIGAAHVKQRTAQYSIRIPSDKVEDFVGMTTSLFNITSSNSTVQDISLNYYTLQRKLEILGSEKVALQAMLEKATTTTEILNIRKQLTNIIEDMESTQTLLAVYDSKVSYSTVKLNVYEVVEYTVVEEEPNFGGRFVNAIKGSWNNVIDGIQNFLIWLIYALPALIIIIGAIAIFIFIYIKIKKKDFTKKNIKKTHEKKPKEKVDIKNDNQEDSYF